MVSTGQQGGKFKLQPLKEKSDDVVEVGLRPEGEDKQFFFQTSVIDKMQATEWILQSFKEGNRVLLIDMRPMKTKAKMDELKRAVDKLKLQAEKVGSIMQLDENWLLLVPKDIDILD